MIKVDLAHKGRTLRSEALLDTGADHFIVLNEPVAQKIGLEGGRTSICIAVGNNLVCGRQTAIDRVSVTGNPQCTIEKVPALVLPQISPGLDVIVGEHFLRSVGATIRLEGGKAVLICQEGPHVPIETGLRIDKTIFILGVAALVIAGAVLIFGEK